MRIVDVIDFAEFDREFSKLHYEVTGSPSYCSDGSDPWWEFRKKMLFSSYGGFHVEEENADSE